MSEIFNFEFNFHLSNIVVLFILSLVSVNMPKTTTTKKKKKKKAES